MIDKSKNRAVRSGRQLFVLVPAHNEQLVIADTITSAKACYAHGSPPVVVVVADNCSDDTARLAEELGAIVLVRNNANQRGKGFALSFGIDWILSQPTTADDDIILVVDADSTLDGNVGDVSLAATGNGTGYFQLYDTVRNIEDSWRTLLMSYAFSLFNGVWLLGSDRLGLGAHLRGNGMGFTAAALKMTPWQASSLAEDLEFSWKLRVGGKKVKFIKEAAVRATMPAAANASKSQRQRWEAGRKALRKTMTGRILRTSSQPLWKKAFYLIDLWMPALSILTIFSLLGLIAATILRFFMPTNIAHGLVLGYMANFSFILVYLVSPFFIMNLSLIHVKALFMAPYYGLWRLLILLKTAPVEWVRTSREKQK